MAPPLVLASASPRRADILRQLGLEVEVHPAHVDEAYLDGETASAHVERLAREKAEAVARVRPGSWVVGGDTVVVHRGRVLGKPAHADDAVRMLLELAGSDHEVLSGVALTGPHGTVSSMARTAVRFRAFDEGVARDYVATGEPLDKAGAYGIQGLGAALVEEIHGDYYTVVGFPVARFLELLDRCGRPYDFGRGAPPR